LRSRKGKAEEGQESALTAVSYWSLIAFYVTPICQNEGEIAWLQVFAALKAVGKETGAKD